MTATAKQVLEDALALPEEDREKVAELLLVSLDRNHLQNVEKEWNAEAMRRLRDAEENPENGREWSEVYGELKASFSSQ